MYRAHSVTKLTTKDIRSFILLWKHTVLYRHMKSYVLLDCWTVPVHQSVSPRVSMLGSHVSHVQTMTVFSMLRAWRDLLLDLGCMASRNNCL